MRPGFRTALLYVAAFGAMYFLLHKPAQPPQVIEAALPDILYWEPWDKVRDC